MAHLVPYPFGHLVRRMLSEFERESSIFNLPSRKFFRGDPAIDCTVIYAGHAAASPIGPAAGPHTQMAQNLVLSWLAGSRILELKTVQVKDDLSIPRPCIDMRTVGYNAEWSQELTIPESLEEYVKGAMLITLLRDGGIVPSLSGFESVLFDMSLGYDLAGIQSPRVQAFVHGLRNADGLVDKFRAEIPAEYARLRDLDYPSDLSDTVTLSTFHGCPPHEIERIVDYLMVECGLNAVIKFNPMLLGKTEVRGLLAERGYSYLTVPDAAFERDITWDAAIGMMERLEKRALEAGVTLGAKFNNTLVVENRTGFLPDSQREVYLSGPPLHVLAVHLVAKFRARFGDRFPVSFSAGVDRVNLPDLAALGLKPITVCTDLLKTGGYGRMPAYYRELAGRMNAAGGRTLDDFTLRAYDQAALALDDVGLASDNPRRPVLEAALRAGGDLKSAAGPELYGRWVSAARLRNTAVYRDRVAVDPRYHHAAVNQPPKKIGRHLELFDCISCDKCVPVCPNDANFTFPRLATEIPLARIEPADGGWVWRSEGTLALTETHQIATFADFCNECGNCDVFCPEDGGPYRVKPHVYGSRASFEAGRPHEGLYVERRAGGDRVLGRFGGVEYRLDVTDGLFVFTGPEFEVRFHETNPEGTLLARATGPVDLTWCFILDYLRLGLFSRAHVNYVNVVPVAP